jgi:glycosyltransferase involved in cell wall biosynthesis
MIVNSPRKVIIVGTAFPFRGGLANYNERLAIAYQQAGCQVTIITFSLQYPNFLFPGKTQFSDESAPDHLDIRVELNSVNPFSWIRVGYLIKKMNADLLIIKFWIPFMGPALGTVARIAKRNKKTKVVSIIDNIIPHEKRPGDYLFGKYFVKAVDGFICMSQSVLNDLSTFGSRKPAVFSPHPIYDNFGPLRSKMEACNQLGIPADENYLLFFGFIRDYKGLDLLLLAMADERIKQSKIKLIVAGEFYNDKQVYIDIINKYKLDNQLILATDFIPDSRVGFYFNACDLVVQPYKTATQSGVTQIAYHFEKPMLVTRVGGLPEIVLHEQTGYVVDVDPKAIADAILDFFQKNRMSLFQENAKIEKRKYSWETMIAKIDSLFE